MHDVLETLLSARLNHFFLYEKKGKKREELRRKESGKVMELMDARVKGCLGMEETKRVAVAMNKVCTDQAVGRASGACKRFIANDSHPSTRF